MIIYLKAVIFPRLPSTAVSNIKHAIALSAHCMLPTSATVVEVVVLPPTSSVKLPPIPLILLILHFSGEVHCTISKADRDGG